jgi:hypothetical protein
MAHIYKFAILRLVPFAHRGEALNVGVVVFAKDRLDIKLGASVFLLSYFGVQASTLDWLSDNLARNDDSSLSVEERAAEVRRFAGVQLSDIGWFGTDDDNQYDPQVSEILSEYVDKPRKNRIRHSRTNISKDLRKTFKEFKIFSSKIEDLDRHKIIPNMPVGPSGKLHVDFLIKNGLYHATETIDFRHSEDAGPTELKNAALANVTFQHAREVLGIGRTKCYLVYAAPSLIESVVHPALEIARKDASDSFNLESREDKVRYLDTILAAAGVNHLFS